MPATADYLRDVLGDLLILSSNFLFFLIPRGGGGGTCSTCRGRGGIGAAGRGDLGEEEEEELGVLGVLEEGELREEGQGPELVVEQR